MWATDQGQPKKRRSALNLRRSLKPLQVAAISPAPAPPPGPCRSTPPSTPVFRSTPPSTRRSVFFRSFDEKNGRGTARGAPPLEGGAGRMAPPAIWKGGGALGLLGGFGGGRVSRARGLGARGGLGLARAWAAEGVSTVRWGGVWGGLVAGGRGGGGCD